MDSTSSNISFKKLTGSNTNQNSATNMNNLFSSSTNNQVNSGDPKSSMTNDELASLFECPVCFDYIVPPILQCQNGHLVCQPCKLRLTTCPSCRVQITSNIRNLQMEKVASTIFFPCKYSIGGCKRMMLYKDKPHHEESCRFKLYICPCPGTSCKWQGSIDQVMPHLTSHHKSITTLEGEDIVFLATDINLSGAVDWVMIQSCFNHHFMLVLEKQERYGRQQFFAVVQIIGSQKQADSFLYRLELSGPKRRILWEATPKSIFDGVQNAINTNDCLVFDTFVAQKFSENGNLGINVTIHKLDDHHLK